MKLESNKFSPYRIANKER